MSVSDDLFMRTMVTSADLDARERRCERCGDSIDGHAEVIGSRVCDECLSASADLDARERRCESCGELQPADPRIAAHMRGCPVARALAQQGAETLTAAKSDAAIDVSDNIATVTFTLRARLVPR